LYVVVFFLILKRGGGGGRRGGERVELVRVYKVVKLKN
jgi:hypothetical protein